MIFVDTGAWYACTVPADVNHAAARQWLEANTQALVTSDYVVDETLTLLRIRGYGGLALLLGETLLAGELADVITVTAEDFRQALDIFRRYRDKEWSFTDCTCKAMMERLAITEAFAFDRHYRQFGSVNVVP